MECTGKNRKFLVGEVKKLMDGGTSRDRAMLTVARVYNLDRCQVEELKSALEQRGIYQI
jgi:hypothetical protein